MEKDWSMNLKTLMLKVLWGNSLSNADEKLNSIFLILPSQENNENIKIRDATERTNFFNILHLWAFDVCGLLSSLTDNHFIVKCAKDHFELMKLLIQSFLMKSFYS